MALLDRLRVAYHAALRAGVLCEVSPGLFNNADSSSSASRRLAEGIAARLGPPFAPTRPSGQTAGAIFAQVTRRFLESAFSQLATRAPGPWEFATDPSLTAISSFAQYEHLAELSRLVRMHQELAATLGGDYIVAPDITIARPPLDDLTLTGGDPEALGDRFGDLSHARASNSRKATLHASVSCKWTMRSDRAQNTRTEALNLLRNRKGRAPHIVAVTMEPLPSRLASIALGTGDVDMTYHAALHELEDACAASGLREQKTQLNDLVDGGRLRDISDLPLDLLP